MSKIFLVFPFHLSSSLKISYFITNVLFFKTVLSWFFLFWAFHIVILLNLFFFFIDAYNFKFFNKLRISWGLSSNSVNQEWINWTEFKVDAMGLKIKSFPLLYYLLNKVVLFNYICLFHVCSVLIRSLWMAKTSLLKL